MRLPIKDPTTIRSGALTTSLDLAASVALTEFDRLQCAEKIGLWLEYTPGSGGTGVEYVVEASPVATGDDWFATDFGVDAGTPASAVATATDTEIRHQIVTAVSRVYRWTRVPGAQRLRVRAKELGMVTVAGTLTVRATAVGD